MVNMAKLVQQAKDMQDRVAKAQEQLGNEIVEGSAGGGLVTVKMNGRKFLESIEIKDEALKDKEELCDLIVATCRDAAEAADALTEKRLTDSTGGFKLSQFNK